MEPACRISVSNPYKSGVRNDLWLSYFRHLIHILLKVVCSLYINDSHCILVKLLKAALCAWIVVINIVFCQIVVHCVSTGEWAGHKE